MSDGSLTLEVAQSIRDVEAVEWNALTDPNDPFTEHAFLALMEESGSVGTAAGWVPVHLLAKRNGALVGAVPLYLKDNSYGEYIFDWGWAQAAQRSGLHYYPKLVSAVPFTPATGRRLLAHDEATESADWLNTVVRTAFVNLHSFIESTIRKEVAPIHKRRVTPLQFPRLPFCLCFRFYLRLI